MKGCLLPWFVRNIIGKCIKGIKMKLDGKNMEYCDFCQVLIADAKLTNGKSICSLCIKEMAL
jgi:hypothetical protein